MHTSYTHFLQTWCTHTCLPTVIQVTVMSLPKRCPPCGRVSHCSRVRFKMKHLAECPLLPLFCTWSLLVCACAFFVTWCSGCAITLCHFSLFPPFLFCLFPSFYPFSTPLLAFSFLISPYIFLPHLSLVLYHTLSLSLIFSLFFSLSNGILHYFSFCIFCLLKFCSLQTGSVVSNCAIFCACVGSC